MFFAIDESAFVYLTVFVFHDAFSSCHVIIRELTLVLPLICFILASPMLLACYVLSLVD